MNPGTTNGRGLDLDGCYTFPGLVNSHDHLEFNLFPALGSGPYANYVEWGKQIHRDHSSEINDVLRVPKRLRALWGVYKNLLCGVTTVVHHGSPVLAEPPPIEVLRSSLDLHSVRLHPGWRWQLNSIAFRQPLSNARVPRGPVVIHVGEGLDERSRREARLLRRWNLFKRPLIGIHALNMDKDDAAAFRALVWCPEANDFLFRQTAPMDRFKEVTHILFGTDSTLTGGWNIWDHLRLARSKNLLDDRALMDSVTTSAAAVWGLPSEGADLVVAERLHESPTESFFRTNPENIVLVVRRGKILLFDERFRGRLPDSGYSSCSIRGSRKYVIGDLSGLLNAIRAYHPGAALPV